MNSVCFDSAQHTYSLNGRRLPSVTEVIREAGLMGDCDFYTEEGRIRGSYIAQAIKLHEDNDLDMESIDPAIRGHFDQYLQFKEKSGFKVFSCEELVCDEVHGYAGMLDLWGELKDELIVDVKCGAAQPWHSLQLYAYRRAKKSVAKVANLYLSDDSWKLVERKDRNNEAVFLAALALVKWKHNNGVK